jgi:hypothetical protein
LSIFFIPTFSARSPRLQYRIAHSFHFMPTKVDVEVEFLPL